MHLVVCLPPPLQMQTTKLVLWGKLPRKGNIESGKSFFMTCHKTFSCFVMMKHLNNI